MTCRNCFTSDETGKRSPASNCPRVKWMASFASPTIEKASPSENSKLMSSGTQQKDLNSSTNIEATRMLAVGDSQLDPFSHPT